MLTKQSAKNVRISAATAFGGVGFECRPARPPLCGMAGGHCTQRGGMEAATAAAEAAAAAAAGSGGGIDGAVGGALPGPQSHGIPIQGRYRKRKEGYKSVRGNKRKDGYKGCIGVHCFPEWICLLAGRWLGRPLPHAIPCFHRATFGGGRHAGLLLRRVLWLVRGGAAATCGVGRLCFFGPSVSSPSP